MDYDALRQQSRELAENITADDPMPAICISQETVDRLSGSVLTQALGEAIQSHSPDGIKVH